VIGVVSRRELVLRALRRLDWAPMTDIQATLGASGVPAQQSLWRAAQKLVTDGLVERDDSTPHRYRITTAGLTEYARIKAVREVELLSV
jgi:DNA-binding IclR family transcriptional regulator